MFRKLSKREQVLSAAAVCGLAIFVIIRGLLLPLADRLNRSSLELEAKQALYLNTLKIAGMVRGIDRGSREETQKQKSALVASLLRDSQTAAGRQVIIRRFQPLRAAAGPPWRRASRASKTKVETIEIQLECLGKLPDLMAFFESIEATDALTRIRHFYLSPDGGAKDWLQCQLIVIRAYVV